MDRNEFAAELRRMVSNNGIHFLKEDQLLQVMSNDIVAGANFINIIPSFSDKNTFLLINTRSVLAVKTGMLGPKVVWSVLVTQIKGVQPTRSMFRDYTIDEVRIETTANSLEFRFGFFNRHYDDNKAEMAQGNAQVATHEVNLAVNSQRSTTSPPQEPSAAASEGPQNTLAKQLDRFILSLSLLTGAENIGRPFGEGLGLESAISLLSQSFHSIDAVRHAGEMMAVTIVGATGKGQATPDDVNYFMGTSNLRDSGLTADQAAAADGLAGAAFTFLGQLHETGANMWELWKKRDDVAGEFLCWHAVAWGRLAALGRVDPIMDQARRPQKEDRSSGPSAEWKACRARLQNFCDALSPFTGPEMVGQPLAEGLGLEQVIDLITRHFLSPDDVRQADTIISMDLISETGRGHMTANDLAAVMGATPEAQRKTGLSAPQLKLAIDLAEAAQVFLGQFDEDGGEIWELWKNRDDVAAEFLSWHTVARLRLATTGAIEAIEPI